MKKILPLLAGAALGVALAVSPVRAAEPAPPPGAAEKAEQALREGAEKMIKALDMLIQSIPMYEPPKILDNGDIIIRRKNPDAPVPPTPPAPAPDPGDHTAT